MQVNDAMVAKAAEALRLCAIERGHPVHPAVAQHLAVAAITAALAEMWRSVEEAPKSRGVLLFAITDVAEDGTVKNWKMDSGFFHEGYNAWSWEGQIVKSYNPQPTHFMPLPSPPKAEG